VEIGIDASRAFATSPTGIGVYATQVISRLLLSPPAPMRLYLNRSRPPELAPELPPGSQWRCIPLSRGWTAARLRWELRRSPPQLLWVPAYRLPGGKLPRSVVTVHGVEHRLAPSAYPRDQARAVESFVLDTLRRAARVISPSETTKADLVHLFGADPNLITVIPHGAAAELRALEADERAPLLRKLGVEPPYFLIAGAHHPRKNVPFLLTQFARAFPPGAAAPHLVVANAGEALQSLLTQAAALGVGDRLTVFGHVAGVQLAALYSGAVAVCVPSLYEGFGLPALEAMACGAPVIGNATGGVQEVAEGAALLLAPSDPDGWVEGLRRLAEDGALRQHLRRLGLTRASRFSWDLSAAAHAELLLSELLLARG
jgi:glycosyltransferase involved in cell wall biosynthesis